MMTSIKSQTSLGTSLKSLVKGFVLTKRTDCESENTVDYYEGILTRFLWYANQNGWPDDARLITQWHIREILSYISTQTNRWGLSGNGSESSKRRAEHTTVHLTIECLIPSLTGVSKKTF